MNLYEKTLEKIRQYKLQQPRNTVVEKTDMSGRFKIITTYNERGTPSTRVRPIDTRFNKGQSGNPRGRPRGRRPDGS